VSERRARDDGTAPWRGLLADVRRALAARGRARLGCFAIEGTRLHERALRAGWPPEAVLVSRSAWEGPSERVGKLLAELGAAGCRCEVAPDGALEELTAGRGDGPLVGLVRLPASRSLGEILESRGEARPVVLVGVEVEDPGNVGALIRTALAVGASAFVGVGITDAFHPRAVRTSMGSLFKLPALHHATLGSLLRAVDGVGLRKLGAVSREGTPLPEVDPGDGGVAVLVGGEAFGLDRPAREAMDQLVCVPMTPAVDSLSVNAAAAVILYELGRRRDL